MLQYKNLEQEPATCIGGSIAGMQMQKGRTIGNPSWVGENRGRTMILVPLTGFLELKILEEKPGHVQQQVHTFIQAQKLLYHKASKTCTLEGMVCVQKPAVPVTLV